jgi:hypothetical protein
VITESGQKLSLGFPSDEGDVVGSLDVGGGRGDIDVVGKATRQHSAQDLFVGEGFMQQELLDYSLSLSINQLLDRCGIYSPGDDCADV